MSETRLLEVPIAGMDCAECTEHVRHADRRLPGVVSVEVFLASEKAAVRLDPAQVSQDAIRGAVEGAGYRVAAPDATSVEASGRTLTRQLGLLLAALFGVVLFVAVVGEGLGVFERLTELVPWPVWLALVVIAGYPIFRNVIRATLHRQIISHTLMTIGVLAAIAVGQWMTALVVVFFMRVGDAVERFTTDRARRSLKSLTALAPRTARVDRDGAEVELPIDQLRPGDIVIVRPGEQIPADGEVLDGQATVDQAAITGESLPVEAGPGSRVYAATFARLGHLRVRVTHAGADSTYGRVVQQVEEAEANRADIQRTADRFSTYFLPIVLGIATLTFLLSRDPLATAAVLVVACSCSIALATPIAVLASVGAAAKHGLLIKGGRYLELLDRADVLLVDKTGTVTLGKPEITDVVVADGKWQMANGKLQTANGKLQTANGDGQTADGELHAPDGTTAMFNDELLRLAASAERYSEHPLAEAVRAATRTHGLILAEPRDFVAEPGVGVRATVDGVSVAVGSRRLVSDLTGLVGNADPTDRRWPRPVRAGGYAGSPGQDAALRDARRTACGHPGRGRHAAARSAGRVGGAADAGNPPHRAPDRRQRAGCEHAGGGTGRALPGQSAARGQDSDRERVPGAGSHRRDGRRRGQRRAGAGPGGCRHRDGRGGLRRWRSRPATWR